MRVTKLGYCQFISHFVIPQSRHRPACRSRRKDRAIWRSQSQLKVPRPAIGRPTWKWGRIVDPFIGRCPAGTRPMSAFVPVIPMRYPAGCMPILTGRTHRAGAGPSFGWPRQSIYRSGAERCLVGARTVPDRYINCLGCSKFASSWYVWYARVFRSRRQCSSHVV